jgi:hypothetical protein
MRFVIVVLQALHREKAQKPLLSTSAQGAPITDASTIGSAMPLLRRGGPPPGLAQLQRWLLLSHSCTLATSCRSLPALFFPLHPSNSLSFTAPVFLCYCEGISQVALQVWYRCLTPCIASFVHDPVCLRRHYLMCSYCAVIPELVCVCAIGRVVVAILFVVFALCALTHWLVTMCPSQPGYGGMRMSGRVVSAAPAGLKNLVALKPGLLLLLSWIGMMFVTPAQLMIFKV